MTLHFRCCGESIFHQKLWNGRKFVLTAVEQSQTLLGRCHMITFDINWEQRGHHCDESFHKPKLLSKFETIEPSFDCSDINLAFRKFGVTHGWAYATTTKFCEPLRLMRQSLRIRPFLGLSARFFPKVILYEHMKFTFCHSRQAEELNRVWS